MKKILGEVAARAALKEVAEGVEKLVDGTLGELEERLGEVPADDDPLQRIRVRYGLDEAAPARPSKADEDARLRAELAELKRKMGKGPDRA